MSNVRSYTDNQLLNKVKSLQGFKQIPHDFWILGVRSNEDESNVFDDKFYIFKGNVFIMVATGTTNPSIDYLTNKMNKRGAFIIKSEM